MTKIIKRFNVNAHDLQISIKKQFWDLIDNPSLYNLCGIINPLNGDFLIEGPFDQWENREKMSQVKQMINTTDFKNWVNFNMQVLSGIGISGWGIIVDPTPLKEKSIMDKLADKISDAIEYADGGYKYSPQFFTTNVSSVSTNLKSEPKYVPVELYNELKKELDDLKNQKSSSNALPPPYTF